MPRWPAIAWLLLVLVAATFLGFRVAEGLHFRTDLLALLPREEADVVRHKANEAMSRILARRAIFLIGSPNRETSRSAALQLAADLQRAGVVDSVETGASIGQLGDMGKFYFPFRAGLLAERDRMLLANGKSDLIAARAMSQAYSFLGPADAALLRQDPFLLLPAFFADLPLPMSRLQADKGMLTVVDNGITWVLVTATLRGDPFALEIQERFVATVDSATSALASQNIDVQEKRLGTVFFAHAGARKALFEASLLGTFSIVGVVLLIVTVFRSLAPLLMNVLSIAVGVSVAMAACLLIFAELHVAVLLFGVGLIGIAVDYGLHYSATLFAPSATPMVRLRAVLPGISLGLLTTMIGYATLLLAPFPGLRQIAAFSSIGIVGAFLTVVLCGPYLDRRETLRHGRHLMAWAGGLWRFWSDRRWRTARAGLMLILAFGGVTGLLLLETDDDVRRMQSLEPGLLRQQEDIQRLIGGVTAPQFILIEAADNEAALRRQEELTGLLNRLVAEKIIAGFQMPAAFIPSAARQRENHRLVQDGLLPLLGLQWERLGMAEPAQASGPDALTVTLDDALASGAVPLLPDLILAPGLHAVMLQGVTSPNALRDAFAGESGIRVIDPAADYSDLLAQYRHRAMLLIAISALLMLPAMAWRYRMRCFRVIMPPVAAVLLTLAAIGLLSQAVTFFHVIALVLVLSIGVDYAIFCAEGGDHNHPTTHLAVWLATLTTLLSFGLMAFSQVAAVHGFGLTMLIGIGFAMLLAPLAGQRVNAEAAI